MHLLANLRRKIGTRQSSSHTEVAMRCFGCFKPRQSRVYRAPTAVDPAATETAAAAASHPDPMRATSFRFVRDLGSGGTYRTGTTGLFHHIQTGEGVAVKLIKRPLPKAILPSVMQEIAVRRLPILSGIADVHGIGSLIKICARTGSSHTISMCAYQEESAPHKYQPLADSASMCVCRSRRSWAIAREGHVNIIESKEVLQP